VTFRRSQVTLRSRSTATELVAAAVLEEGPTGMMTSGLFVNIGVKGWRRCPCEWRPRERFAWSNRACEPQTPWRTPLYFTVMTVPRFSSCRRGGRSRNPGKDCTSIKWIDAFAWRSGESRGIFTQVGPCRRQAGGVVDPSFRCGFGISFLLPFCTR